MIDKKDERLYLPSQRKPFPDPNVPMPKYARIKVYRNKPMIKEYQDAAGIQIIIDKPHPKPKIMRLIGKETMRKRIRKNPWKYAEEI